MRSILLSLACLTFVLLLSLDGYAKKAQDELAFEAEDFDTIQVPMQVVKDADVSGGAYIKSPSGRAGWVEYEIEIPEDAEYYIWGMIQEHDGVTDSFFVAFDLVDRGDDNDTNENTWDIDGVENIWGWDPVSGRGIGGDPRKFVLDKGTHKLRIWTRENETWLDCIFMSTDPLVLPVLASEFEGRERKNPPEAVTYRDKLPTAWGYIKTRD